jgi:hypothetical protein
MYAGLKNNAGAEEVISAAEADGAPFVQFEEYKTWVRNSMETLRKETI